MWGGIAGFAVLSGGLIAIWRALSKEIREIRDNHLKHTDEKITGITTRLDQTRVVVAGTAHPPTARNTDPRRPPPPDE